MNLWFLNIIGFPYIKLESLMLYVVSNKQKINSVLCVEEVHYFLTLCEIGHTNSTKNVSKRLIGVVIACTCIFNFNKPMVPTKGQPKEIHYTK